MSQFESRPIGRTQLKVTVFGQGGAPLGGHRAPSPWPQAEAVMDFAWENGIRYFDTAPFYGSGHSEEVVGRALKDLPTSRRPLVFTYHTNYEKYAHYVHVHDLAKR